MRPDRLAAVRADSPDGEVQTATNTTFDIQYLRAETALFKRVPDQPSVRQPLHAGAHLEIPGPGFTDSLDAAGIGSPDANLGDIVTVGQAPQCRVDAQNRQPVVRRRPGCDVVKAEKMRPSRRCRRNDRAGDVGRNRHR